MSRERRTAIGVSIVLAVCTLYRLLPVQWPEDAALRYGRMCVEQIVFFGVPAVLMRPWRSSRIAAERRWWVYGAFLLAAVLLQMVIVELMPAWFESEMSVYPAPGNPLESLLMICALAVMPAVCEEAFFRGAMYCGLIKKMGYAGTFWLVTALFALMHMQLQFLPFHMAVSLLLTLAMRRTGRIWLPMAMHALINGMGLMN